MIKIMETSSMATVDSNFSKSSMSVVELNNYIVSMRPVIKRAKQQAIQKLVKQIKLYRNKKGTDEQRAANSKKADRLLLEITILKRVDADRATKYSLGNVLTFEQAAKTGNLSEKVLARIACNKLVCGKVAKWRLEHDDWDSLAAFAVSKNTGRRYKKKKSKLPELVGHGCAVANPAVAVATTDEKSSESDENDDAASWHSEDEDINPESMDSDDEDLSDEAVEMHASSPKIPVAAASKSINKNSQATMESPGVSKRGLKNPKSTSEAPAKSQMAIKKLVTKLSSSVEIPAKSKIGSKHLNTALEVVAKPKSGIRKSAAHPQQTIKAVISTTVKSGDTAAADAVHISPARREVVVKRISLDELSDEELFLPPPDEEVVEALTSAAKRRKTKNSFFVASDDDDEVSGSDQGAGNEDDETENVADNTSDDHGGTVRVSDIKSTTLFAKSLSFRSRTFSRSNSYGGNSEGRFNASYKHRRSDRFDGRPQKRFDRESNARGGGRVGGKGLTKTKGSKFSGSQGESGGGSYKRSQSSGKLSFGKPNRSFKESRSSKFTKPMSKQSATAANKATGAAKSSSENEKLHPSWMASKQRKEREKNVFIFQGTKKTFGDDD